MDLLRKISVHLEVTMVRLPQMRRLVWLLCCLLAANRYQCYCCHGFHIQQGTWTFLNQYPIAYERAQFGVSNNDPSATSTGRRGDERNVEDFSSSAATRDHSSRHDDSTIPILILNGFGMGSFHQHRLMKELLSHTENQQRCIYGMDYLGQGRSWPVDCNDGNAPSERGLAYSGRTWVDQTIQFIEQTILAEGSPSTSRGATSSKKVHLMGNSVGGYLAVCVAAERPDLVESLCLMNATPIWGLNLPGWSGTLPAPRIPRFIGRVLFDVMRNGRTIDQFLRATYVHTSAYDGTNLAALVQACTNGPGGHAAFASILWSPPVTVNIKPTKLHSSTNASPADAIAAGSTVSTRQVVNFYDCLEAIQCDVLLLYGRDDPWCKPAFAKRMLERLEKRRRTHSGNGHVFPDEQPKWANRYIELTQVGHCPNHEAPKASAMILTKWLASTDGNGHRQHRALLVEGSMIVDEEWASTELEERSFDQIPLSFVDRLAVTFI